MKYPHVLRRFLGLLLTVACATGGSGLPCASAATVPPPPKPPIETLIEPGDGLTRTKYGQPMEHVHKIKQSTDQDKQDKQSTDQDKQDKQSQHDD